MGEPASLSKYLWNTSLRSVWSGEGFGAFWLSRVKTFSSEDWNLKNQSGSPPAVYSSLIFHPIWIRLLKIKVSPEVLWSAILPYLSWLLMKRNERAFTLTHNKIFVIMNFVECTPCIFVWNLQEDFHFIWQGSCSKNSHLTKDHFVNNMAGLIFPRSYWYFQIW